MTSARWLGRSGTIYVKGVGGLRLKDWGLFNKALLGKWRWRILYEFASIWCKVLRAKYTIPRSGAQVEIRANMSAWWKDILRTSFKQPKSDWLDMNLSRKLGNGEKISFWHELWAGNKILASKFGGFFFCLLKRNLWYRIWVIGGMGFGAGILIGGGHCLTEN